MIVDGGKFRPLYVRRLVPSGPQVQMAGPGTRFAAGDLVEPDQETVLTGLTGSRTVVLALTGRKR